MVREFKSRRPHQTWAKPRQRRTRFLAIGLRCEPEGWCAGSAPHHLDFGSGTASQEGSFLARLRAESKAACM